jgi:hypothetical protein
VNRIAAAAPAEAASIIPHGGGAVAILIASIVVAAIAATIAIEMQRGDGRLPVSSRAVRRTATNRRSSLSMVSRSRIPAKRKRHPAARKSPTITGVTEPTTESMLVLRKMPAIRLSGVVR